MKLRILLVVGFLGTSGVASAQQILCPDTGIPMSQDPGCTTPNYNSPEYQELQQAQPPPQPTGYWEKTWGAIAPSPKGGVLGTALGARSKQDAERRALADCKAKGGAGCKVELAYHNQCAVMVVGDNKYRLAGAESISKASEHGMQLCKERGDTGCQVYYSACTEPIYHQY